MNLRLSSSLPTYPTPAITFNGNPAPLCASQVLTLLCSFINPVFTWETFSHSLIRGASFPHLPLSQLKILQFIISSLNAKSTSSSQMEVPQTASMSMQEMPRFSPFLTQLWRRLQQQRQLQQQQQQQQRPQPQQQQPQLQQRILDVTAILLSALALTHSVRWIIIQKSLLIRTYWDQLLLDPRLRQLCMVWWVRL